MGLDFDAIIIGSGFGGAVTACRLSEAGMRVLVLERGRRWQVEDYPRAPEDAWLWGQHAPEHQNGWMDLRIMDDMTVAQGAGVGGGSLIYANVSVEAKPDAFASGWPPEIDYAELKPYYDRVGKMLNVQTLPETQATERYKLMREAAERAGYADRFRALPLAVTFDAEWRYAPGAIDPARSKPWINAQGQQQGTCVHCGNCDIGCGVKAKNTLDLNYIPWAEKHGAEVRALHLVKSITPQEGGYRVDFDRLHEGHRIAGTATARIAILAAGSLGSTELLLRCRDEHRTLPQLSACLGHNWSSNGDFLTPAFYRRRISPTQGPTITCAIDFLDGSEGARFFVEDGGFPNLLGDFLQRRIAQNAGDALGGFWSKLAERISFDDDPLANVMPWFGQSMDAADGRLYLGRNWVTPWRTELKLDWDVTRSEAAVQGLVDMHKKLSEATGGEAWVPPTWTVLKNLVTPHPLGGCGMGITAAEGVVNHLGEVFNYAGLYVADGAIVPRAIGLNPSRTIAALAERIADKIVVSAR